MQDFSTIGPGRTSTQWCCRVVWGSSPAYTGRSIPGTLINQPLMNSHFSFRRGIAGIGMGVVTLLLVGCSNEGQDSPTVSAGVSNVVMICVDTVRWDTWWTPERAGFEDALTPWMSRSQTMAQAMSAAPWTVPSVATVLTGLYPSQHGGGLFEGEVANLDKEVPSAINPAVPTLAEMLSEGGVRTAAVSAHPWFGANYGFQRGFEEMHLRSGAEKVTRRGLEWLDANASDSRPFFLYLHYMDVHDPHLDLSASRSTVAGFSDEFRSTLLATAPDEACDDVGSDMCARYLTYTKAVLELRTRIASLLEDLGQRGLLDSTLVVLYSDHGEEFHDHRQVAIERDEDPRGIYGFGHGNSLYQEQLHVPLQLWHSGHPGREIAQPVSLVDVVPSILDWMGLSLPEGVEFPGLSFVKTVESSTAPPFAWDENQRAQQVTSDRQLFASGIAYGPEQLAVIDEGHKLIWHYADNSREFYDLRVDPLEQGPGQPPSDRRADALDASLDRYFDWFDSQDYLPPELTDDMVEELKGVGYLQGVESKTREEDSADGQRD